MASTCSNGSSHVVPIVPPRRSSSAALETLAERDSYPFRAGASRKSPAEAVADILQLRQGVQLGGLKIKDLIHEGHKY